MCGIFGMILPARKTIPVALARAMIDRLLRFSEIRGSDSSGLAVLAGNEIRLFKKADKASRILRDGCYRDFVKHALARGTGRTEGHSVSGPLAVIGHTRMETDGSAFSPGNNQPIVCGPIVGVHNGIIVNADSLWKRYPKGERQTEVDSEIIFRLIQSKLIENRSVNESLCETFRLLEGMASIAGLIGQDGVLFLATNNGSLHLIEIVPKKMMVFASEAMILRKLVEDIKLRIFWGSHQIRQLPPGQGCAVDTDDLRTDMFSLTGSDPALVPLKCKGTGKIIRDESPAEANNRDVSPPLPADSFFQGHLPAYRKPSQLSLRRCTRCVLPETMPFITFDTEGVCSYCRHNRPIRLCGEAALVRLAERYRKDNRNPDCIVGLSGGRDSTFGLHYIKTVLKMNPVAYTYDWGMVTDLARRNISRICGKLGVEHILVSADIRKKRRHIKANVLAWLRNPHLGTVPLFMAGDKAYFYHAQRLKRDLGIRAVFLCENMLERTDFKTGFAGVPPHYDEDFVYTLTPGSKLKLIYFYLSQFLKNPAYLNASLPDTMFGCFAYYFINREYDNLYKYIAWDENQMMATLRAEYDWETASDTSSSWRIGDGTASFYNYIYYSMAGFTENDTFRSNQIRSGLLTRDKAMELIEAENAPRFDSIREYCRRIDIDFERTVRIISDAPKHYRMPKPS